MHYIALDLETTGLDPQTDTIIEIAAIRFDIEARDDRYEITGVDERTMLIAPGRVLTREISMITGITSEMLIGKPSWGDVRERVREFIGEGVIVGHNVLFDVSVLATHGIDLTSHVIIDTFELSEICSREVESLNLGFLATHYGLIDPSDAEHRAISDVRMSIRLLLQYLQMIRTLPETERTIWSHLADRDESHTLRHLLTLTGSTIDTSQSGTTPWDHLISDLRGDDVCTPVSERAPAPESEIYSPGSTIELSGDPQSEILLIEKTIQTYGDIQILTPGKRSGDHLAKRLRSIGINPLQRINPREWCSVEYLRESYLASTPLSRKEMILILKLASWILETETGLLSELKFYGSEREMIDMYRTLPHEYHIWRQAHDTSLSHAHCIISDLYQYNFLEYATDRGSRQTLIKDITLLEDIARRANSREVSFAQIRSSLGVLSDLSDTSTKREALIHVLDMMSIIEQIYVSIPTRPTGPLASPPGDHGETYFITQNMLWHRGSRWLIHATLALMGSWDTYRCSSRDTPSSRVQTWHEEGCEKLFGLLSSLHTHEDTNTNIILMIQDDETRIHLIPRSVQSIITPLLTGSISYGSRMTGPSVSGFLEREYGIETSGIREITPLREDHTLPTLEYRGYSVRHVRAGSVILTTSQKQARDLGGELRTLHGKQMNILIQGLSGGKGKMLSIFKKGVQNTILIGLIDTWRDEYSLWESATDIIIAKIPFDPPTDPYFLARTVGMRNNFSEYSEPIVTIRLNILIMRIRESGYHGSISTSDIRLLETEWGKHIAHELL